MEISWQNLHIQKNYYRKTSISWLPHVPTVAATSKHLEITDLLNSLDPPGTGAVQISRNITSLIIALDFKLAQHSTFVFNVSIYIYTLHIR